MPVGPPRVSARASTHGWNDVMFATMCVSAWLTKFSVMTINDGSIYKCCYHHAAFRSTTKGDKSTKVTKRRKKWCKGQSYTPFPRKFKQNFHIIKLKLATTTSTFFAVHHLQPSKHLCNVSMYHSKRGYICLKVPYTLYDMKLAHLSCILCILWCFFTVFYLQTNFLYVYKYF
jgi:hypothetical protein